MRLARPIALVFGLLSLLPLAAWADGFIISRPAAPQPGEDSPRPRVDLRGTVRAQSYPLEVKHHKVKVEIAGGLAQTAIDQVFVNAHALRLEGTYLFPVPHLAAISQFSMDVSGTQMEGEVQEATPARAVYESIVREVRDPAILEYVGDRLVSLKIFPIEPHATKPVMITYSEVLTPQRGLVTYRYPLNTEKFSATPLEEVEIVIDLVEDCPIGAIYSPTHAVEIERLSGTAARVRYHATKVTPERDLVLCYQRTDGDLALSLLTHPTGPREGYFAALLSPHAGSEGRPAADVVVAIDTSTSMGERDKLAQVRRALGPCLAALTPRDRFAVVDFSTLARGPAGLVAATPAAIDLALRQVEGLAPNGGTNLEDALARITEVLDDASHEGAPRARAVFLVTDGSPTVGARDTDALAARLAPVDRGGAHRLFVLGVGDEVDTALLDGLAERHGGFARYAAADADLARAITAFYGAVALPAVTGATLTCTTRGAELYDFMPAVLGDLFAGTSTVLLGRYRGAGEIAITLAGTSGGAPYERRFTADLDRASGRHGLIGHLHGRRKVGALLARIRAGGETAELKRDVCALARRHGILTPYTSFLVLENERMWNESFGPRRPGVVNERAQLEPPHSAASNAFSVTFNAAARADAVRAIAQASGADGLEARRTIDGLRTTAALGADDRTPGAVVRHVGDRTFYQESTGRWVDAECSAEQLAAATKVAFGSDPYFALLDKIPGSGAFLSLGESVAFVAPGGQAIEVVAR